MGENMFRNRLWAFHSMYRILSGRVTKCRGLTRTAVVEVVTRPQGGMSGLAERCRGTATEQPGGANVVHTT